MARPFILTYKEVLPLTVKHLSVGENLEQKLIFRSQAGFLIIDICIRLPYLLHNLSAQCKVSSLVLISKCKTIIQPVLAKKERALELLSVVKRKDTLRYDVNYIVCIFTNNMRVQEKNWMKKIEM